MLGARELLQNVVQSAAQISRFDQPQGISRMHLLLITYEYLARPFSGNGLYAASQVRGLQSMGIEVHVLAGMPSGCSHNDSASVGDASWV
jgi:hypothetical protein